LCRECIERQRSRSLHISVVIAQRVHECRRGLPGLRTNFAQLECGTCSQGPIELGIGQYLGKSRDVIIVKSLCVLLVKDITALGATHQHDGDSNWYATAHDT
jgi:hypothetical protein